MNRHANFMCIKITGLQEAYVVSCHYRQLSLLSQCYSKMEIALFIWTAGPDQFEIITIGKILLIKIDALMRQLLITTQQHFTDVALAATGEQDETFAVFNQPITVNDWSIGTVPTLIGVRNQ